MTGPELDPPVDSEDVLRGSTAKVVERLGCQIVEGGKPRDQHLTVEAVMHECGVTRPMAREALQTLHQKGLINLQPRIGATVQALERWDLLDPDVIAWRLEVAPDSQMRSLTELREVIEPRAARLAALSRSAEICHDLTSQARTLLALSEDEDFAEPKDGAAVRQRFRDVDAAFHRTLLAGSRNELFLRLSHPVVMALNHRIDRDWAGGHQEEMVSPARAVVGADTVQSYPTRPQPIAMWLHMGLAYAVDQGLAAAAEAFAEAILAEIRGGRLQDPVVLDHLRAGLDQFNTNGLPAAHRAGFQDALASLIRARRAPVVVMGASGCGKTTVGPYLAESLRVPFEEGDRFHPPRNLESLRNGTRLDDSSCSPWLAAIAGRMRAAGSEEGLVITCSALRRIHREMLRVARPDAFFVHLDLDQDLATARVAGRESHVMPASLVSSQFEDLEPLQEDEAGMTVDATLPVERIVAEVQTELARRTRGC
ncbi:GntR family transcriptional regulator [Streptomyces luteolifulvus]|uniref:gluconokinase n=1 Tax=Streptomyces luteolifulvus TaxID=2615112 RepID=A0A6H9V593_9ACTN|nr:gluconokinase, GntK/IdnK-type [Streptomyces luteolifulvus]KAB1147789.1 GntR family transcriptional regulator [Streptomyces luteolifulvus]